jgi:hypothetical protein
MMIGCALCNPIIGHESNIHPSTSSNMDKVYVSVIKRISRLKFLKIRGIKIEYFDGGTLSCLTPTNISAILLFSVFASGYGA